MNIFKLTQTAPLLVALGLSLALIAAPASAAKKGPRASVLSETACSLQLDTDTAVADLVVETTLTNKSSGNVIAELRNGSGIESTSKLRGTRGNVYTTLGTAAPDVGLPADIEVQLQISATFDLCQLQDELSDSRAISGQSTVMYGISGGDGETRNVVNRCSDSSATVDVDEGSIKVDDYTFQLIAEACGW